MTNVEMISGAFVLTPAAGKKLIGMAVAQMPEVRRAYEDGRIAIANGTATAYVIEALTGKPMRKYNYCIGLLADGRFNETAKEDREPMLMLHKGQPVTVPLAEFIREFERDDVFMKGGNAVDPNGFVGGMQGNPRGGTWADVMGAITARGCHFICPVGQEKLIPSVIDAARKLGQKKFTYSLGGPVGMMPVVTAKVVTEVEALEMLAGVNATVVAAGGIGGDEGARAFVVEGTQEQVEKAFAFVKQVYQEPSTKIEGTLEPLPHNLPPGW